MDSVNRKISTWAWILFSSVLSAAPGQAAVTLRSDSLLRLTGDSTLHPYTSTTTLIRVALEPATVATSPSSLESMIVGGGVKAFNLTIPVESLKSGEKGLDKNMYAALHSDRFPEINFRMEHYDVSKASDSESTSIQAEGKLAISGVEKPVILRADLRRTRDAFELQGSYRLMMTDFGVKPPTFMMGMLKVKYPVIIYFDLYLVPGAETIGNGQANK